MTCATFLKEIRYNRACHDFDAFLDAQYIGSFPNHHAAENALNTHALDLVTSGICHTATELDGGARIEIEDDPPLPNEIPGTNPPHAGRAIARHFHSRPTSFIATLRQLDPAAWLPLAEAYAEWRGTDATAVLDIWMLAVQGTHVPANARA